MPTQKSRNSSAALAQPLNIQTADSPYSWILSGLSEPAVLISRCGTQLQGNKAYVRTLNSVESLRAFWRVNAGISALHASVERALSKDASYKKRILVREASGVRRFYQIIMSVPREPQVFDWILVTFKSINETRFSLSLPAIIKTEKSTTPRTEFAHQVELYLNVAKQKQLRLLIFVLDIVGFRAVNESEGYHVGDQVLYTLQHRLSFIAKNNGLVAHIADDDYAVALLSPPDAKSITQCIDRMSGVAAKSFYIKEQNRRLHLRVSAGVAISDAHTNVAWRLVEQARNACIQAKREGDLSVRLYVEHQRQDALNQFKLEQKLYRAIQLDELYVVFQPQYSLDTNQLVGAEALVRWTDEDGIAHPPSEFIPVAVECGLLAKITSFVLRRVLELQQSLLADHVAPVPIAINVAPIELQSEHFVKTLTQCVHEYQVPQHLIEIEITEDSLLNRDDITIRNIEELHQLGIKIALDDFGVGYSSLNYLRYYPIKKIKIDRSFVATMLDDDSSKQLIKLMVNIGLAFNMQVLAEGVESETQAKALYEMGCQRVQGFWYARPEKAIEFIQRLNSIVTSSKEI